MRARMYAVSCILTVTVTLSTSDFQPGFRETLGFREHLPRVPRLVSKEDKK